MSKHYRHVWLGLLLVLLAIVGIVGGALAQDDPADEDANIALIEAYFEAISGKEKTAEVQDQFIGESDQILKEHIVAFESAFPLYQLIADDIIAQGDKVVVRATLVGTHEGEFAGAAPTGMEVEMPLIIIYRIEDGKIAEHWMQADMIGLMQQIGALPAADA